MGSGLALGVFSQGTPAETRPSEAPLAYEAQVKPFFEMHCLHCHGEKQKADLDLRLYTSAADVQTHRDVFRLVLQNVEDHTMPPESRPRPDPAEIEAVVGWLRTELARLDCTKPDPGRVTLRRLNRVEYNNTIRDLLGVDFEPAADFPMDDIGYGFDNIGDVLSMPPILFEKYLAAAERIMDAAVVTGPPAVPTEPPPLPETHRRIFFAKPADDSSFARIQTARVLIERFARRAFRRPATPTELDRLTSLYEQVAEDDDVTFEAAVRVALEAVLVSPRFLFRLEAQPNPDDPAEVQELDEFALASRLSYFLWSTMPDEELLRLAGEHRLRANLDSQVRRLLTHPKAQALVDNFAGQWLELRRLGVVEPDSGVFPQFSPELRTAMRRETELFFEHILREDRSVLEFLDADYTFANPLLARFYGLPMEEEDGDGFRKVSLKGTGRGGLLTQASFLTITSNPTRTSPVKRGKWVLENILGTPPPEPPANVPPLDTQEQLTGTLRERMEQHRADPLCASCHQRMDPIGFGFENFDGVGAWRDTDAGAPVDASGELVSGETFAGADGLRRILLDSKRDEFLDCLAGKLLTYAIGRGVEHYDQCAVDEIVKGMRAADHRFSSLVLGVVHSAPFQLRRGDPTASSQPEPKLAGGTPESAPHRLLTSSQHPQPQ